MNIERAKVVLRGAVQGVGFRPFVYRLATELGLTGWVINTSQGVFIEVEGERVTLNQFVLRLDKEKPPRSVIQGFEFSFLDAIGYIDFEIRHSEETGAKTAFILPDIATCADCLREIFDPNNRRHLYPFTNCTNCGPRFTIIESLPYDRPNTSMKHFKMCPKCEAEYQDPGNRRFHAQPNACPVCGPKLNMPVATAAEVIRRGQILALKGIGGFQLLVDARNAEAITRLRQRKHRDEKPFAVMYPSLEAVKQDCRVSELEERVLLSPESPIVLLESKSVATAIAPGNPYLGVMLPYSPLHHLLMRELTFPVVATSGNRSDEPICINEFEAHECLDDIADAFLMHDRPIVRPVDDSVVRVMLGRELVLRRARGYAPLPVHVKEELPHVLAVGAHLKNTVALSIGHEVFISQHIGDLEMQPAFAAFRNVAADFQRLYEVTPELIACDMHPEYLSTKFARELHTPRSQIQHHYAHIVSCMTENELEAPVLGVAWDGTGYGTDGTIWGGEFLLVDDASFERVAHLRQFRLPGGEAAIKQPRRCALGVLYEIFGDEAFTDDDPPALRQMLVKGVNCPFTSSAGRLFDAVASLLGIRHRVNFEGQAAMELEFLVQPGVEEAYPAGLDWQPMVEAMLQDDATVGVKATKFHNALAETIVQVAQHIGEEKVVLTGGCFQNRYLTERAVRRLQAEGFHPYWHQRVPPNDGGIALGQVVAAARAHQKSHTNVCSPCLMSK
jgi:hydrogenase maturation protein HypF